jgi:hypothetical protein
MYVPLVALAFTFGGFAPGSPTIAFGTDNPVAMADPSGGPTNNSMTVFVTTDDDKWVVVIGFIIKTDGDGLPQTVPAQSTQISTRQWKLVWNTPSQGSGQTLRIEMMNGDMSAFESHDWTLNIPARFKELDGSKRVADSEGIKTKSTDGTDIPEGKKGTVTTKGENKGLNQVGYLLRLKNNSIDLSMPLQPIVGKAKPTNSGNRDWWLDFENIDGPPKGQTQDYFRIIRLSVCSNGSASRPPRTATGTGWWSCIRRSSTPGPSAPGCRTPTRPTSPRRCSPTC